MSDDITWFPETARLTESQCASIGEIATRWSVLEFAVESVLTRLAGAPDFPGLALTNDLSMDNRLKALRTLLEVHEVRYGCRIIPKSLIDELAKAPKTIAKLKEKRNKYVHYVWMRSNDTEMFGLRFRAKLPPRKQDPNSMLSTIDEALDFANMIEAEANRLLGLCNQIPGISEESWLEKFPRPQGHPPHLEPQ